MNKCSVGGCTRQVRAKRLCSAHYERLRAHGDVTVDKRRGQKVPRVVCVIEGCTRIADSFKMKICAVHRGRLIRHGSFDSLSPTYGSGIHIHEQGYVMIRQRNGRYKMEHVILAEKALGKSLPKKAVVHHMNENPIDNHTPFNLVICPDQAYHFLLHRRMRAWQLATDLGLSATDILADIK